jgi:hypothetical protein
MYILSAARPGVIFRITMPIRKVVVPKVNIGLLRMDSLPHFSELSALPEVIATVALEFQLFG